MSSNQMMKTVVLSLLLAVLSGPGMAKSYKWVDSKGGVHYTQLPPVNHKADIVDTHSGPKDKPVEAQTTPQAVPEAADTNYNALVQEPPDEAMKQAEALQRKQTEEACKTLRSNLKILQQNAHIRIRSNKNEEPRVLTPEERSQRIKQYRENLDKMCK